MSRSLKKPYLNDQQNGRSKKPKKASVRAIRQLPLDKTPKNGKSYKKQYNSWDIRDFNFYSPEIKKAHRK